MKFFKPLMFALVAMLMMSCAPAFAAPGAAVKPQKHAVVKAVDTVQAAQSVAFAYSFDVPALPGIAFQVPKTKVFGLNTNYGVTVRSDISHRYRQVGIGFKGNPYNFYLYLPPLIAG